MEQYISLQYHLKDFIGLIPKATQYRKKFGFNQDVLHHAVEAYTSLGQYREALSTLDEIVAINPSFEDKLRQADLQIRMGNLSSANSHLQRMLIDYRNEELDRVYALLGDCNYRLEQYGYAADYLINAININNREADYYFLLAETYHETRNRTEALKNYALAFQLAPEQADYGMGYARALERENRFSEALGILDSIAEIAKEYFSTADFHRLYSDLLLREGRYDDAYREILIVQNYFPEDEEIARKVEEAFQAREYYNQNKAPVEIKTVEFDPVYPSLYEYYKQNPVGSVKLFNNRSVPITDIQVQVILPEVTDRNYSVSIPSLTANDVYEQLLVLELNRRIFNQKRDINPRISISYTFEDSIYTAEYDKAKLSILPDKAMNWNNRQQYASFVNPGDEALRTFVTSTVLQSFSGSSNTEIPSSIQKALQIYNFYRANHIRFANDPSLSNIHNTQIDLVQYPFQTLNSKAGDCDDLLVLLAASLEVIGVETGFIDIPGHVMLAIDTNLNLDQIMKTGLAVEYFISRNDTYWLPLESTTLGTHDFNQSWLAAIRRYDEEVKKGVFPEIFKFAQLHISYPPAPYSKPIETAQYANKTLALSYANEDISRITRLSQISQEQEFLETLKRYPNNLIVKNKYARWSLSNGKSEQGERLLLEILEADPTNFTALVNLGNLYYFGARYSLARAQFLQALQQNKDTDELYRNLCLVEYRDNNKSRALEYFRKIQNKDLVKNADFTIYSELIQQGE
jgi:tetratricopeptide (TPR) repeat protein